MVKSETRATAKSTDAVCMGGYGRLTVRPVLSQLVKGEEIPP